MSSPSQFYRLITLSDRVVPGFAGIMRAAMITGESLANRELKVIIASQSQVSEGKAINFAKKVTKYIRVNRRWSFVNDSVESIPSSQLPALGRPHQTKGQLTAWVVE
jgi:hypothetical protein